VKNLVFADLSAEEVDTLTRVTDKILARLETA